MVLQPRDGTLTISACMLPNHLSVGVYLGIFM